MILVEVGEEEGANINLERADKWIDVAQSRTIRLQGNLVL